MGVIREGEGHGTAGGLDGLGVDGVPAVDLLLALHHCVKADRPAGRICPQMGRGGYATLRKLGGEATILERSCVPPPGLMVVAPEGEKLERE